MQTDKLEHAFQQLKQGRLSRREFIERATALGVGLPVVLFLVQSVSRTGASAQNATPVPAASAPSAGTEGQARGAGGELNLLQWQAPTTLSMHHSSAFNNMLPASLVTEPLLHYLPDGTPIPCLVREVPSVENRLLAEDLTSVTYHLLEGVTWSDGEPFTADDVVFTWQWIMNPDNQAATFQVYEPIETVEAVDDLTVRITFKAPQLGWYAYFASSTVGGIYPEHILSAGADATQAFQSNPIGTGPFVVESFVTGDRVTYVANERYREPNKPSFARVNLKGGGDPTSAARAVLQTGDYDFAWNLQVEPDLLNQIAEGGMGEVVVVPGTAVEWIMLNFSDPDKEVNGQRSYWQEPHPFLSDLAVRQALALGVDRQSISEQFYAGPPGEPPTSNVLVGIPQYESPNTTWEFNIEKGNQLLDDAGWVRNGDFREKDGVQLEMVYSTSVNPVRQQTQAVVRQGWMDLGIEVELREIEAGVFFDSSPGNDQNIAHMYVDCHEYAFSPASPFPLNYMLRWVSHNGENIPQRENDWARLNESRYNNPDYDALYDQAAVETDNARAAELFIQMNDILINDVVLIPLVQRASEKYGIATSLRKENIEGGPFEALYWNIANWNRVSD
jgi:peptide/nickel transport system substrate-binding protein